MQLFLLGHRAKVLSRWHEVLSGQQPVVTDVAGLQLNNAPGIVVAFVHISSLLPPELTELTKLSVTKPHLHLVACDDVPSVDMGIKLLQDGFSGYTNTYVTPALQQEIIKSVQEGEIWAGPEVLQGLIQRLLHRPSVRVAEDEGQAQRFDGLSSREQEVLAELVKGFSNKEIARELEITERTVKAHLSSIFAKTGAPDRVSLVLMASGKL